MQFRKGGVVFEILSVELRNFLIIYFCCYDNRNKDSSKSDHILGLPLNYIKKCFQSKFVMCFSGVKILRIYVE